MKSRLMIPILMILSSLLLSCAREKQPADSLLPDLTILYTNDEHGWMEETSSADGAAKLMGVWTAEEGYLPDDRFLILSGGDNWTGPAISTWFQGASMVEVMNAMHYQAAAIGNHEFDFQVSGLQERIAQANFPYLSANIRYKGTDSIPDFATPYALIGINDIEVGIIGLTTTSTSYSTFPTYVEDYEFIDYATALEEITPRVWDDGAELVLCIAHICYGEMQALAPTAEALGISMVSGGHCNELVAEVYDGSVALIEGGWQMANYAKLDIWFDRKQLLVTALQPATDNNQGGTADSEIADIVTTWAAAAEAALGDVIGYMATEIPRNSPQMYNLVTDSWLYDYPQADIAITNSGGIRQPMAAGDITRGDIVGVLPFDNNILELQLTGQQVIDCLGNFVVAGLTTIDGYYHSDGTPLELDSAYSVLTTDYLYVQDQTLFHVYDPDPFPTGLNYHQPTVDYIRSLNTSTTNPLDNYLDYVPRR